MKNENGSSHRGYIALAIYPIRRDEIEAIEETGNVLFALTAALAGRIEAEERISLRYLGLSRSWGTVGGVRPSRGTFPETRKVS